MKYQMIIIYDGIENSVFSGQVLIPFAHRLTKYPNERGLIISFEHNTPHQKALIQFKHYPSIDYLILHKIAFLGALSLRYAAHQLQQAMAHYSITSITARGPLAAWIVAHTKSLNAIACRMQARGLAAQEYRYEHDNNHAWLMQKVHQFRAYQYEAIERYVYTTYAHQEMVTIESVSAALRTYIIETFGTRSDKISVEAADIPEIKDITNVQQWRTTYRYNIKINLNAYVYVYNGSAKSWQCPEETVAYFAQQYKTNTDSFLLILTQDQHAFSALCTKYTIPLQAYHITSVSHDVIYQYLAVADAGIIFRKPHIINWVSRPTKILEYQAVGLKIIHNNTVGMLADYHT